MTEIEELTRDEGHCCRSALLDCAAASTEVSVLYMFSLDAPLRELARNALLCAHACTRGLRHLLRAEGPEHLHWHEMQTVARLCEAFASECQDGETQYASVSAWKAACLEVARACKSASDAACQKYLD